MSQSVEKITLEEILAPEKTAAPIQAPARMVSLFLGRDAELADVIHRLSDPACRLLTLVGPGGVGKTRLAEQVAAESRARFEHGVAFVPLAPIHSPEFIPSAIATALRLQTFGQEDMKKQVLNFLREKEILLVLDNFEHLLEEADWLVKVRDEAPRVKFLVTSRESLGLRGEKTLEVRGLGSPLDEHDPELDRYGAIQLFLHKARAAKPDFQLLEEDRPYLVSLCRSLDGMPLGLELAAGWVKTLSIQEILSEIKKNRDFLASTYGELPERHRSLRAAFEYSWKMVGPGQKEILRKLAVFRGEFPQEAAEFVTGAPPTQLALLADKSILRKGAGGRFEIHSLLKQYLIEKLEEIPELREEINRQHCLYHAGFMRRNAELLWGPRQKEALDAVGMEIEDIRGAWQWAFRKELHESLAGFIDALFLYYDVRGLYQEGERVFGDALGAYEDLMKREGSGASKLLRALYGDLLGKVGRFQFRLGRTDLAIDLMRRSLDHLKRSGSEHQIVFVVNQLSFVIALVTGAFAEAKGLLEENLETCERNGDKAGLALSLRNLGYVNWKLGNLTEARQQYHRAQNISQEMGDAFSLSIILTETVNLVFDLSRYEEAEELCLQTLKVHQEIGHRSGMAWTRGKLGNIHWALGNFEIAKKLYEGSLKTFRETGDREGIAWGSNSLGHVLRSLGNYNWALESYKEGFELYRTVDHQWGMAWVLANEGHLQFLLGKFSEAETAFSNALRIFRIIQNPWGTAYALDGLALVGTRSGQNDTALKCLEEGLGLFKKAGNSRETALTLGHLAEWYESQKDGENARKHLTQGLKLAADIFAAPVVFRLLLTWARLSKAEGDLEEAWVTVRTIEEGAAAEWETREPARALRADLERELGAETIAGILQKEPQKYWQERVQKVLERKGSNG